MFQWRLQEKEAISEGETLGDDRDLGSCERLRGEINNRVGQSVRIGVSVGRRELKYGGKDSWNVRDVGSLKIEPR